MSTKIYNAFLYQGKAIRTPAQLFALSMRIRNALRPWSQILFYRKAAAELVQVTDRATVVGLAGPDADKSPYFVVRDRFDRARENLKSGAREPSWDTSATWTFHFVGKKILFRIFAENAIVEVFERLFPEFTDYYFQDGSDSLPPNVSRRSFNQRRKDWDAAIGHESPAERGFEMNLWGEYSGPDFVDLNKCLRFAPGLSRRANAFAYSFERDRWINARIDRKKADGYDVMRKLNEFGEVAKLPPMKRRIARRAQLYRSILIPRITKAHVLMKADTLRAKK